MAEQEPGSAEKDGPEAGPKVGGESADASAAGSGEPGTTRPAAGGEPASPSAETPGAASAAEAAHGDGEAPAADADAWEPFDAVLQAFGTERAIGVGSIWGESAIALDGRFAGWANASGWRCTLQLVRAPEENVVVLIAQGPPLPGGRARVMVLGAFPPEFERDTLRAALEVGYGIGETWGPAEDPLEPPSAHPAEPGPEPGA